MRKHIVLLPLIFLFSCRFNNSDKSIKSNNSLGKVEMNRRKFVYDSAKLLDSVQTQELSSILKDVYESNGIEMLCVITPSYKKFGNDAKYTDDFLHKHENELNRNLIIIVLFIEDRKMFIRTTKGWSEKNYPPEKCQETMDLYMIPQFKKGEYFEGIKQGISNLTSSKNT